MGRAGSQRRAGGAGRWIGGVGAAAAVAVTRLRGAGAVPMGAAWTCTSQPGPFSIWINEVHYLGEMAEATRAVEVMALAAAGVNYANIDLLLVDSNGAAAARRNLATTCVKTAAGGTWAGTAAAGEAWMCDNWVATLDAAGGGLALVNNRGTTPQGDDLLIQYISVGPAAPFMGVAPCPLPASQGEHLNTPGGVSLQLVDGNNGATAWDASLKALNVYGWNWQGMLPQSWGVVNDGASQWGQYAQTVKPALLTAPAGGNPALVDAATPPPAGGAGQNCTLGPVTDWSVCSLQCTPAGDTTGPTGWQVRYSPLLAVPANGNASACTAMRNRTEMRACTPTRTCDACSNLLVNTPESDIDCGGGMDNPFPANMTEPDRLAAIAQWYAVRTSPLYQLVAGATGGAVGNASAPAGPACNRCQHGRTCSTHADCDMSKGLACVLNRCTPAWLVNATWASVDFDLHLQGMAPNEMVDAAIMVVQMTVAEVADGNGANVTDRNVTLTAVTYFPHGAGWNSSIQGPLMTGTSFRGAPRIAGSGRSLAAAAPAAPAAPAVPVRNTAVVVNGRAGRRLASVTITTSLAAVAEGTAASASEASSTLSRWLQTASAGTMTAATDRHLAAYTARRLANQDDVLRVRVRVAADSAPEAVIIGQNIRANWLRLTTLLSERLRMYSPLLSDVQMGQPTVVNGPYADWAPTSGRDGGVAAKAALSTPAIIGIAVGAAAGLALLAVGIIAALRGRRDPPPPRPRRDMNIGETVPAPAAMDGRVLGVAGSQHVKAAFAPAHPGADGTAERTAPAVVVGGAGAGAAAATGAAAAAPKLKRRTPKGAGGAVMSP